jgi:hypothetical protein
MAQPRSHIRLASLALGVETLPAEVEIDAFRDLVLSWPEAASLFGVEPADIPTNQAGWFRLLAQLKLPPEMYLNGRIRPRDVLAYLAGLQEQREAKLERTGQAVATGDPGRPRKLLTGWHEITKELEMKYAERKKIKSLNDRLEGPIANKGPGTPPMVYREKLLEWWNKLAIQQQEIANQREGARLSAEAQHNYAREGTVAPEIGGSVKKRRRDGHT